MVALVAPQGAPETAPSAQGTLIVVKLKQFENELFLMVVGVPSNVSEVKLEQPLNAFFPILVIPLGNEVSANFLQS